MIFRTTKRRRIERRPLLSRERVEECIAVEGSVCSVSGSPRHGFSKPVRESISLIKGYGVEGDAHAGAFVRHRYLARWRPRMTNERQVHLIDQATFDELRGQGFNVQPGQLGENITTVGVELLTLPLGTELRLGPNAVLELRGLRTPCVLIDRFQKGLLKALVRKGEQPRFRAGVMGVVREGGVVSRGDLIRAVPPMGPLQPLPPL